MKTKNIIQSGWIEMIHEDVGRGENFDFAVEFFGVWQIKETQFEPEDCGYDKAVILNPEKLTKLLKSGYESTSSGTDMSHIVEDIIKNAWARYEFGAFYGVGHE